MTLLLAADPALQLCLGWFWESGRHAGGLLQDQLAPLVSLQPVGGGVGEVVHMAGSGQ